MMRIPNLDIGAFIQWTNETTQQELTILDFPMSAKVYANYDGPERNMLASFTTIVPGAGKGKDAYWCHSFFVLRGMRALKFVESPMQTHSIVLFTLVMNSLILQGQAPLDSLRRDGRQIPILQEATLLSDGIKEVSG